MLSHGQYCNRRHLVQCAHPRQWGEMAPVVSSDFAFDSTNAGRETSASWESHAVDRSLRLAGGANGTTYTIQVQYWVVCGAPCNTAFRLDDWHLTVEAAS